MEKEHMRKRKFLFLYLNTGNGHLTPARRLKESIERYYPEEDFHIDLVHGFAQSQHIARFWVETGYRVSSATNPAMYSFTYDVTQRRIPLYITKMLVSWRTTRYLYRLIKEKNYTDIVCFHFMLTPSVRRVIRRLERKINFTVVVTDPFSVHGAWFIEKDVDIVFFSEEVKKRASDAYGFPPKTLWRKQDIKIFPFILSSIFKPIDDYSELRKKLGLDPNKKMVLVAGGGEGLPNMMQLMAQFALQKFPYTIVAVCGRNKSAYTLLTNFAKIYPKMDIRALGYINNMHEYIQASDCVVTKAGASTVMEILACQKPIIFSTFIHGQELGNVQFVVRNKLGWFLRSPKAIHEKIDQLFSDAAYRKSIQENLKSISIPSDNRAISTYIVEEKRALS